MSRHRVIMPPLVGRQAALDDLLRLARTRQTVAVGGPAGVGRRRLLDEAAARLVREGALPLEVGGHGPLERRIAGALRRHGLSLTPSPATGGRPAVILLRRPEAALATLARRLAGTGAMALAVTDHPVDGVPSLMLDPLLPEDARAIAHHVRPLLDGGRIEEVISLGEGLPGRVIALADAAGAAEDGMPLPIPARLREPIERPLDDLGRDAIDLCGWLTLLGRPAVAAELAELAGGDTGRIAHRLEHLERIGVVRELPGPPEPRWRTAGALVDAVLRARLGPAALRRRSARALAAARRRNHPPTERLALAVGAADAAAVVAEAIPAAAHSRGLGHPARALEQVGVALAWSGTDPIDPGHQCALREERGRALHELARWDEAADQLERAASAWADLGHTERSLACAAAAARAHWSRGHHATALRCLDSRLSRTNGGAHRPSAARAEALAQAAGMAAMTSRFGRATELARAARSAARLHDGTAEAAVRALAYQGTARAGRGDGRGLAHLEEAAHEAATTPGVARHAPTLVAIHHSHALLGLGHPRAAAEVARTGHRRARELGLVEHEHLLAGNLGEALIGLGRLGDADRWLEGALEGWRRLDRAEPTPAAPAWAWLHLARGDIDRALRLHRRLTASLAGDGPFEQRAGGGTGHVLTALEAGHTEEAVQVAATLLDAWRATDDRLLAPPLLLACCSVPDPALAARAGGHLLRVARRTRRHPAALAFGQMALGLHRERRDPARAAGALRRAADRFERLGLRLWAAHCLMRAGRAAADGRATTDLLAARDRLRHAGAESWSRRAEALLRRRGVRVATPGRPRTGRGTDGGLSARELEVLDLLALGLRNRDIGDRLFISERTVARHLGHIYAKLGVSTRTAAVAVARDGGILDSDPI